MRIKRRELVRVGSKIISRTRNSPRNNFTYHLPLTLPLTLSP